MQRIFVQPILPETLPRVAEFLFDRHVEGGETLSLVERRLRWLQLENPNADPATPLGFCLRDENGKLHGMALCYPVAFAWGERRLLALGSGSFYVDSDAQSMGFYLFKRYLGLKRYAFYFASTCNAVSGQLWSAMGGCPGPKSDIEYLLPLRLDRVMPEYVAARTSSRAAAALATWCSKGAGPVLNLLTGERSRLAIQPCEDWEKLSSLAARNRRADVLTSDRSPEMLAWRYGSGSPAFPCRIFVFRDEQGSEGWFALGDSSRGTQKPIRESVLLDAVWPQGGFSFGGLLSEVAAIAAETSDILSFRWQPGIGEHDLNRLVIPYRLPAPRAYVRLARGSPAFPLNLFDYDDSESVAWRFNWQNS